MEATTDIRATIDIVSGDSVFITAFRGVLESEPSEALLLTLQESNDLAVWKDVARTSPAEALAILPDSDTKQCHNRSPLVLGNSTSIPESPGAPSIDLAPPVRSSRIIPCRGSSAFATDHHWRGPRAGTSGFPIHWDRLSSASAARSAMRNRSIGIGRLPRISGSKRRSCPRNTRLAYALDHRASRGMEYRTGAHARSIPHERCKRDQIHRTGCPSPGDGTVW